MHLFKDKNKRKGLIGTIGFHLLLLIVFLLYGLTYMVPPPPEISVEVDFGFSETGLGDVEDMQEASQQAEQETQDPETASPAQASAATEETVTQTTEKTTVVKQNKNPEEKPKETVEEKEIDPQPSDELQKRLSKIKSSQKDAKSEGDTKGTGNMGNPEGTDSPNKTGYPGSGDFLKYRKLVKRVRPQNDCPIGGTKVTILMEIIVNQAGDVVRANPDYKGSTTTDPCLVTRAREAAMESKWNRDMSAPPEQKGYFSYIFVPQ